MSDDRMVRTSSGKMFQPRSIGGWIMVGLWLAWQAVNIWSNTDFLITKRDTIMWGVGAVVASRALQWILLIGGVVWILVTVRRTPPLVVAVATGPVTTGPSVPTQTATVTTPVPTPVAPRSHAPIAHADGRIILDVTPDYLTASFNEHTEIQRPKLLEDFVGKWITASGPVEEVLADPARVIVELSKPDRPFDFTLVFIEPTAQWAQDLPLLRKGQTIKVRGRIWKVGKTNVHLVDCELLDL